MRIRQELVFVFKQQKVMGQSVGANLSFVQTILDGLSIKNPSDRVGMKLWSTLTYEAEISVQYKNICQKGKSDKILINATIWEYNINQQVYPLSKLWSKILLL